MKEAVAMPKAWDARPLLILSILVAIALGWPTGAEAQRQGSGPPARGQAPPQRQQQQQQAPPQAAPPKPYAQVPVTLAQPYRDPTFDAFRKQLADVASRKDRAALARLVARNFFWIGEKGDRADKRKSPIDNFAAAIDLDAKDGSGWDTLAEAATEMTLEPVAERKGVLCAPASPMFDESAAEGLAKDTGTEPDDWGYPLKAGVEVHSAPKTDAPVVERLGMNLVRVMPEEPPPGAHGPDSPFVRVVTPSGKVGYVIEEELSALDSDQICYVKDQTGWKIAGYAGGQ
jgi:hypothetical protein